MDDTKADRLPRARPGQIPARPDRVHQQRRRSPERDYSRRSNLLGTPETASSDRDPCPRQSASFDPPQQCKNHRCETHTKQSVFTQPGSWPCENSSARRTRRNISEQLHFRESNHTAYARFDALLENCFFYIWRMYEFLHSQGQKRKGSERANVVRFILEADIASLPRYVRSVPGGDIRKPRSTVGSLVRVVTGIRRLPG